MMFLTKSYTHTHPPSLSAGSYFAKELLAGEGYLVQHVLEFETIWTV